MIMIVGAILGIATVPLFGGRFGSLVHVRLNMGWLVFLSIMLQTLVISVLNRWLSPTSAAALHIISYACVGLFVAVNRRVAGLWLVGLGGLMNLAAIVANGGVMPANPAAVARAGLKPPDGFENSRVVTEPRLAFLGDIFAIPAGVPLANVFSYGDVILNVGLLLVVHDATGSKLVRFRRLRKHVDAVAGGSGPTLSEDWITEAFRPQ
jgi:Family of unknown function (DUF5317)